MFEERKLLQRYKTLRAAGRDLNTLLFKRVPPPTMGDAARRLGMLGKQHILLETGDEIAVLADHCIHARRSGGRNAVERFLAESPPPPDSDEMLLLQSLSQARFSLFEVTEVDRGLGVHVRDLFRQDVAFVIDVGFGTTASPGARLATRLVPILGHHMTTGAGLPVTADTFAAIERRLIGHFGERRAADLRSLDRKDATAVEIIVLKTCLAHHASAQIGYFDPR